MLKKVVLHALREEVGKNMARELNQAVKAKVKEQVIEGILEVSMN